MPELTFTVRWPDGRTVEHYSPSLVVHDHLAAGTAYSISEFRERAATALGIASDRVRAKYGFACSSAAATLADIDELAASYPAGSTVSVLRLHPPLPGVPSSPVSTTAQPQEHR